MNYKHLFFDLDHTLWDFESNSRNVLQVLFDEFNLQEKYNITHFEDFRDRFEAHNERFWIRFRKGFIKRDELRWKRIWHTLMDFKTNNLTLTHAISERYIELLPFQKLLVPHALEVLEYCHAKNYQIHIITNGYESAQWMKIKNAAIDHFFLHVITSENSKSLKPQKEIFEFAMKTSGALANESIMIGDAIEADVLGAQAVGMDQVYYNFRKKEHAEHPTFEISCLSELFGIL